MSEGKFVVGDRVRVINTPPTGSGRQVSPTWVESMDEYAGLCGKVIYVYSDGAVSVEFEDRETWNFAPAWLLPAAPGQEGVFEEPAPVPAEPDAKRRRVSNALYAVLADVTKLEGDFEYQYGYARELVEELAQAKRDAAADKQRIVELEKAEHFERESHVDTIRRRKEQVAGLETQLRQARAPRRLLKFLAVSGWLAAVLSGGVLAFEKISATPVDTAVREAIITLHDATSQQASE